MSEGRKRSLWDSIKALEVSDNAYKLFLRKSNVIELDLSSSCDTMSKENTSEVTDYEEIPSPAAAPAITTTQRTTPTSTWHRWFGRKTPVQSKKEQEEIEERERLNREDEERQKCEEEKKRAMEQVELWSHLWIKTKEEPKIESKTKVLQAAKSEPKLQETLTPREIASAKRFEEWLILKRQNNIENQKAAKKGQYQTTLRPPWNHNFKSTPPKYLKTNAGNFPKYQAKSKSKPKAKSGVSLAKPTIQQHPNLVVQPDEEVAANRQVDSPCSSKICTRARSSLGSSPDKRGKSASRGQSLATTYQRPSRDSSSSKFLPVEVSGDVLTTTEKGASEICLKVPLKAQPTSRRMESGTIRQRGSCRTGLVMNYAESVSSIAQSQRSTRSRTLSPRKFRCKGDIRADNKSSGWRGTKVQLGCDAASSSCPILLSITLDPNFKEPPIVEVLNKVAEKTDSMLARALMHSAKALNKPAKTPFKPC